MFTVVAIIATLSQGQVALPGGLGIAVAVALLLDRRIRERGRIAIGRPPRTESSALSRSAPADTALSSAPSVHQKAQGAAYATTQQPNPLVMHPGNPVPVPAAGANPPHTPSISPAEEERWASALAEFKSDTRRSGLWAKCFSEANGNEFVAQATYLRVRVSELSVATDGLNSLTVNAPEFAEPPHNVPAIPALLTDTWAVEKCTAHLVANGCSVLRLMEGVWEIYLPTGVTVFARSLEALQSVAARFASPSSAGT